MSSLTPYDDEDEDDDEKEEEEEEEEEEEGDLGGGFLGNTDWARPLRQKLSL